ncbi:MAG: biotin/lipoyl-binding protein, partial [Acidimicrobiia bacterium]|nr:biotin/lipoyl-binding protein [Acidimicrobiia bacterium]
EHAERIGYPILIKATAGGGGRGIRRVETAEDLPEAFDSARSEARGAFGDDTVFVEDLVGAAKHIEVQIIGDSQGTVWPVGVRDCSVQRRNQKIIEEAPSPSLDAEQTETVCAAAVRLAEAAGYRNAGTVEFLYEPESRRFSFMEVNARLQVEHPVSEMTTGLDLVKLQLYVASDGHLIGDLPPTDGYAIEARINAEDPEHGFSPSPGRIELLRLPTGPGLRVDTGVEEGDEIAPEFDSMIAKIIAHGSSRAEAIARLQRALRQTNIVIRNGTTNKAFVHDLLSRPEFVSGDVDVQWVDRVVSENAIVALHAEVAIVAAAIDAYRSERAVEIAAFRAAALRGRPMVEARSGRNIELRHRGRTLQIEVRRLGPGDYRVTVDGHTIEAHREDVARARTTLTIGDRRHRIVSSVHGITHFVDVDGQPHRILHDEGGVVRSPAPAVVVSVNVAEGDRVEAGERLAIIEAMKMETAIVAEFAGTVRRIDVHQNDQVSAGARLLVLEPAESADEVAPDAPTLSFEALAIDGDVHHDRCAHWLRAIRQLLLGYDVDAAAAESPARPGSDPCVDTLGADEQLEREDEVLSIFADVLSLFGREADDEDETLLRHGTEGYLFEYLRRVEARAAGLPQSFVDRLTRTLAHFGVDSLDPSPDLDTALARIVRSHQRMSSQIGPVLQLLERRLEYPRSGGDDVRRKLLEEVARASSLEYPAVRDLAREVVYREFDAPFLATMRWQAIEEAKAHVAALDTEDHTPKADHISALVDCPQPLKTMLSRRFAPASPRLRAALLEVMTRRYYRIRPLEDLTTRQVDEFSVASATYVLDERDIHVIATHVGRSDLDRCARTLVPLLTAADEGREVVLDIYLWSAEP